MCYFFLSIGKLRNNFVPLFYFFLFVLFWWFKEIEKLRNCILFYFFSLFVILNSFLNRFGSFRNWNPWNFILYFTFHSPSFHLPFYSLRSLKNRESFMLSSPPLSIFFNSCLNRFGSFRNWKSWNYPIFPFSISSLPSAIFSLRSYKK